MGFAGLSPALLEVPLDPHPLAARARNKSRQAMLLTSLSTALIVPPFPILGWNQSKPSASQLAQRQESELAARTRELVLIAVSKSKSANRYNNYDGNRWGGDEYQT